MTSTTAWMLATVPRAKGKMSSPGSSTRLGDSKAKPSTKFSVPRLAVESAMRDQSGMSSVRAVGETVMAKVRRF